MKTIKKKVIMGMILLFIFLFILLLSVIQYEMKQNVLPLNTKLTQQIVNSKSKEMNDWFSERLSEIATLADFAYRQDLDRENFFIETQQLETRQAPIYESIRLIDNKGVSHSKIYPDFSVIDRFYFKKLLLHDDQHYLITNKLHSKEANQDIIIVVYQLKASTSDGIQYIAAAINIDQIQKFTKELSLYDGIGSLINHPNTNQTSVTSISHNKKDMVFKSDIPLLPDWTVHYTINQDDLLKTDLHLKKVIIWLFIILSASFILFFIFQLDLLIKPIESLTHTMKKVTQSNKYDRSTITSNDEIGVLASQFNQMLDVMEVTQKENTSRHIRLLQEQFKPHFLYNTLNTVQWLAATGEHKKMDDTIKALSEYFRTSLNDGNDYSTIKNELEHVTNYIMIQNIRYENSIHLTSHKSDDVNEYLVPRFIFQPIVENAIYHGIRPSKKNHQRIDVSIEEKEKMMTIMIKNTGVIPKDDCLTKLNDFFNTPKYHKDNVGFGLYGVYMQLSYFYDDAIEMSAYTQDDFFIIKMTVPIISLKGDYNGYLIN
ncbi:sensor histidine kinase [Vagococcus bubulae]|uniref:HAMP domain-containing protein n=1 Tax=Vagococcus bubulae TaxID=1977868 RepID=A0A429ZGQ6_9ENTE|nr:sensor histidine kinase [Vagococcus bubulae]RST92824.1 hypothetical protein CBF36_08210 [Vagococcus bubulae]